jgi:hypothetical protein
VGAVGLVSAPLRRKFDAAGDYTQVVTLSLINVRPLGSSVRVTCHGGGCPNSGFATSVAAVTHCQIHKGKRQCITKNTVDLAKRLKKHKLRPGAIITGEVLRSGWTGRYYILNVRSNRAPKVVTGCLAPGTTKIGAC